jgi:hypothetical protein
MATTPRRWPLEVEEERDQTFQEAMHAAKHLTEAQHKVDNARSKVHANPSLAIVLLSEADRLTSNALACLERIQRCLTVCRGKAINGRWPSVATRQRDDAGQAAETAINLLTAAQETTAQAMEKMQNNPSLAEVAVVNVARSQARSLVMAERIARLMTEASIGRE